MKVVKLKEGYRITCSNGAFEALSMMVQNGSEMLDRKRQAELSRAGKAAIHKAPFTSEGGPLAVTDDRRSK